MDKISREVAEKEVTAWLDHKHVSVKRRDEKKEAIESLIGFIQEGTVSIHPETFEITQNLVVEIGDQIKIKELKWKPFCNVGKQQIHMKNVESTDFVGTCIASACAQT